MRTFNIKVFLQISHLAVETNGNIPIILRGGVGYRYFTVVIKAQPGDELLGRVRAYCQAQDYVF